jgi:23S rRNA (guanosine2251-2'-O)-methyltransferase
MQDWREQSIEHDEAPYHYEYASLYDLISMARDKPNALIVALDHITDVGNLGAIIRSAEVVGASGVLIPKNRMAPVNNAVYRTSAGAGEYTTVAREATLVASLKRLTDDGFWVGGATEHAQQSIWQAPLEGRIVVVMGSEETGISRLVREACDFEFKLPQQGFTQSLNVAQAFTATAYEWLRRTQQAT